jgi:DNA-binding protein HU-beta
VTLKHLAAALAEDHEVPKRQAEAVLGDLVTLTTKHLRKGSKIRLTGLGVFQVRWRAARMGRNPATGEAIQIKASKKVAFRPAKGAEGSGVGHRDARRPCKSRYWLSHSQHRLGHLPCPTAWTMYSSPTRERLHGPAVTVTRRLRQG